MALVLDMARFKLRYIPYCTCCRSPVAMDGDLYDEFGNYIGPELESDESEGEEEREGEGVSWDEGEGRVRIGVREVVC